MIDIHVLTHSGTRQDWLDQCLASLASEPCTVHVVEGIEGNICAGRVKGFSLGDHPYVGYVDSDDYVLPGVMDACLEALETHRAVVTMEQVFSGEVQVDVKANHHLRVYQRADLLPILPALERLTCRHDAVFDHFIPLTQLAFEGYVWRHDGMRSRTKLHDPADLVRVAIHLSGRG